MDYSVRPHVPDQVVADVTNTLARWLPADDDAAALADWDDAAWRAAEWVVYWHSALPWFVERLRHVDAPIPAGVCERLYRVDAGSRERTRRMLDASVELLAALAQRGVCGIPLKGAILAPRYYADPLRRPLADLDILVHPHDLPTGIEVLTTLGYRFYSRSAEDEVYLRGERHTDVWHPDNVQPVELHYALREEYGGLAHDLADEMWDSSAPGPYWADAEALITRRPALLHHVCAHASSDLLIQRGRLMHIDDLRVITGFMSEEDWDDFARRVRPASARFVYPALAFVSKYTPLPIPTTILSTLRADCPAPLVKWIDRAQLAETSESNPAARDGLGLELARLLGRSRRERAGMLLRSTFPRRNNLTKRYPQLAASAVWPICYLLINADRLRHIAGAKLRRP